jgi:hypothetical protein
MKVLQSNQQVDVKHDKVLQSNQQVNVKHDEGITIQSASKC